MKRFFDKARALAKWDKQTSHLQTRPVDVAMVSRGLKICRNQSKSSTPRTIGRQGPNLSITVLTLFSPSLGTNLLQLQSEHSGETLLKHQTVVWELSIVWGCGLDFPGDFLVNYGNYGTSSFLITLPSAQLWKITIFNGQIHYFYGHFQQLCQFTRGQSSCNKSLNHGPFSKAFQSKKPRGNTPPGPSLRHFPG